MYISGHKYIINKVLLSKPDYFDTFGYNNIIGTSNFNRKLLMLGLQYPDVPCNKYEVSDMYVAIKKKRKCSMLKLYKTISKIHSMKEMYQSHNGVYAFLHSMSNAPSLKVKNVVANIMNHIVCFAFLSIYDNNAPSSHVPSPSIFWIGIILHMITDSYAQSHTVRLSWKNTLKPPTNDNESDGFAEKISNLLFSDISKHRNLYTSDEVKQQLFKAFPDRKIQQQIEIRADTIYKAYLMYKFEKQILNIVEKTIPLKVTASKYTEEFDIINFQHYNNQDEAYHKKKDLLIWVKKYPEMYKRMKSECSDVLSMYKQCLLDIIQNPDDHLNITKQFVTSLFNYLLSNTFRISKTNWNNETGVIYASGLSLISVGIFA